MIETAEGVEPTITDPMDCWRELEDEDLTCPTCKVKFKGLSQVRTHIKWSEHNKNAEDGECFSPLHVVRVLYGVLTWSARCAEPVCGVVIICKCVRHACSVRKAFVRHLCL